MRFDMTCEANDIGCRGPSQPLVNRRTGRAKEPLHQEVTVNALTTKAMTSSGRAPPTSRPYNFARQLNMLSSLTPYEHIAKSALQPKQFIVNPTYRCRD